MTSSQKSLIIKEFLAKTPLFANILDDHLDALVNIAVLQTYPKGTTLFLEGNPGMGFFIVKSGRIKVYKIAANGKEQILHIFGQEEHFAEVPAFDGGNYPASAAAIEQSEVIFISRTAFLIVLQQHPTLAIAMLASFGRHLRQLAHLVDTLSFTEIPTRLANYLLQLSDRHNKNDTFELDLPKGQLAALLGTIPETLSRTFYKLNQSGIIEINANQIKLCNRQKLLQIAQNQSQADLKQE